MFTLCGDFADGYGYISPFIDIQCMHYMQRHEKMWTFENVFAAWLEISEPSFKALKILWIRLNHVVITYWCGTAWIKSSDFENIWYLSNENNFENMWHMY